MATAQAVHRDFLKRRSFFFQGETNEDSTLTKNPIFLVVAVVAVAAVELDSAGRSSLFSVAAVAAVATEAEAPVEVNWVSLVGSYFSYLVI